MPWDFQGFVISDRMVAAIERYVREGVPPGDFLTAVICNDLKRAVSAADEDNRRNLPAFVGYFYNNCPSGCWGSKEKMYWWLRAHRLEHRPHGEHPTMGKCECDECVTYDVVESFR